MDLLDADLYFIFECPISNDMEEFKTLAVDQCVCTVKGSKCRWEMRLESSDGPESDIRRVCARANSLGSSSLLKNAPGQKSIARLEDCAHPDAIDATLQ